MYFAWRYGQWKSNNKGDACKIRLGFEVVIVLLMQTSSSQTVLQDSAGDSIFTYQNKGTFPQVHDKRIALFVLSPVFMRWANVWFLKVGVQYSRRLSYQCYRQWPKIFDVSSFVIGSQNMVLLTILVIIFISMPVALCWRVSGTNLWKLEGEILVSPLWGGSNSDTLPRVYMRLFRSKMYKKGCIHF